VDERMRQLWEVAELAKQVRRKQKDYFRTRTLQDLRESKDYERKLDAALIELTGGKAPTLFPEPDGAA
jgi:hypothetical protein